MVRGVDPGRAEAVASGQQLPDRSFADRRRGNSREGLPDKSAIGDGSLGAGGRIGTSSTAVNQRVEPCRRFAGCLAVGQFHAESFGAHVIPNAPHGWR